MSTLLLFVLHSLCVSALHSVYARSGNASTPSSAGTGNSTSIVTISATDTITLNAGNASLLATGTGLVYASACDAEKQRWVSEGGSTFAYSTTFETTTSSITISYPTYTETSTILNSANATPYTLCDGFPRIDGHTSTSTTVSSITRTLTVSTFATSSAVYHNISAPACSIQSSDCAVLNSSYYSVYDAWYSYERSTATASTVLTTLSSPGSALPPMCGSPSLPITTEEVGDPTCAENFASIQLLYWPVTTISGNLCQGNVSTTTMAPTISGKPNTYVTWNTTLTSPTVYMAFDGTWVYTSAGATYSDQSRLLLPQSSTAVSSLCGKLGGGYYPPQAVDYANFNYPAPASAYRCQPRCFTNPLVFSYYNATNTYQGFTEPDTTVLASTETYEVGSYNTYASENLCSTIWDDYAPVLSIPAVFTSLAPAGQAGSLSCPFLFNSDAVFFDPPKALTQVSSVVGPSDPGTTAVTTAKTPSVTAEPVSVAGPTTPKQTSTPKPTAEPTTSQYTAVPETQGGASSSDPPSTQDDPSIGGGNTANTDSTAAPATTTTRGIGAVIASVLGMTNSGSSADGSNTVASDPGDPVSSTTQQSSDLVDPVSVAEVQSVQPSAQATGAVLTGSDGSVLTVAQPSSEGGGAAVGSVTLTYGDSTSVPGVGVVLTGSSGVVADGTTFPYTALATPNPTGAVLTGSDGSVQTVAQLSSGGVAVGSATLTYGQSTSLPGVGDVVAGSSGLVAAGSTVAYSALVGAESATQTVQPSQSTLAGDARDQPTVVTIDGQTLTASLLSNGVVLENGQTTVTALGNGAPITIGTQVVSAAASGQLVAGFSTINFSPAASAGLVFTLGGHTYTADSATDFDIGTGTTLTPGGVVTVSGTTFSLGPSGSYVIVDGTTQTLATGAASGASVAGSVTSTVSTKRESTAVSAATALSQTTAASSGAGRLGLGAGAALGCALVVCGLV
ncbi:hypothetical protein LTR36_004996 [Oleoguttula mirabilis]|uniref:Uncharacterized protein n=1 Tax=Oleoguttula mirabilis TaxID=1507867 RepID=A0AAV9JVT6_9PEZI|nr:hypothetical protein LTR36_004996 [Oleoguttula mirabilis]